jgi:hypothetical protein
LPAGTSIRGVSKSNVEIALVNSILSIKNSNSSIRNVLISGNVGSYLLAQPLSLTAITNCELIDCLINVPVYLNCRNIAMAVDLFAKGNEFNSYIVFLNTAGSIVTLGSIVMTGNYINKSMLYISDALGDIGSQLSMNLHDNTTSANALTESDALLKSIQNISASSINFAAFQTSVANLLDSSAYHLTGTHAAISMGSPYPVLRNNIYV